MNTKNNKPIQALLVGSIVGLILAYIANRYGALLNQGHRPLGDRANLAFDNLLPDLVSNPFYISTDPIALVFAMVAFLIVIVIVTKYAIVGSEDRAGDSGGSARWGTIREGLYFKNWKNEFNNILFTANFAMALQRPPTKLFGVLEVKEPIKRKLEYGRNWNNLIIGGSGSGKTYGYVTPNLLQCYGDYFVTDPKGTLLDEMGGFMASQGYKVKSFNTIDFSQSLHYNPLKYVKTDADILSFVNCLIKNTSNDEKSGGDDFWENSERLLYTALIALLRDWFPESDYSLSGLIALLDMASAQEENEAFKSPLDLIFDQLETGRKYLNEQAEPAQMPAALQGLSAIERGGVQFMPPKTKARWVNTTFKHNKSGIRPADLGGLDSGHEDAFALKYYKDFKKAAGKTLKSILISCAVRVAPLAISEVRELLKYDEMELDKLGTEDQKSVIFAILSDTDDTFNFLFAIMMWQSIDILCRNALIKYGGRMPRHTQFVFDEFANFYLPGVERTAAVIRSRGAGLDIILQSISQLESRYEDDAKTIIDCCDSLLFLGGKSTDTNKELAEMIGKETIQQFTYSTQAGMQGSSSKSTQIQGRDLIDAAEIAKMSRLKSVLLIAGANPFMDDKIPTHDHPNFKLMKQEEQKWSKFKDYWNKRCSEEEAEKRLEAEQRRDEINKQRLKDQARQQELAEPDIAEYAEIARIEGERVERLRKEKVGIK